MSHIAHLDSQAKALYTKIIDLYGEELTAEGLEPLALYTSEYYALPRGVMPTDIDATRMYNDYVDAYTGASTTEEIEDYYRDLLYTTLSGGVVPRDLVEWRSEMELYHTALQGSSGHVYLYRD